MKRLSSLLLCAALLLTLCLSGCGRSNKNSNSTLPSYVPPEAPTGDNNTVIRDISTTVYYYIEGEEVVTSERISGYILPRHVPTLEEINAIKALGETFYNGAYETKTPGVHYLYKTEYKTESGGKSSFDYSEFAKYDGDELLWSVKITDFNVSGYSIVDGGVIVYGDNWEYPMEDSLGYILKLSEDGNIIWKKNTEFGSDKQIVYDVVQNDDSSLSVFGNGALCVYSADGTLMSVNTFNHDYTARNVKKYSDGFLSCDNSVTKLDSYGNPTLKYTYKGEKAIYVTTDIIEKNGLMYISAYSFTDTAQSEMREYATLNDLFNSENDELTARLRNRITAVLLTCDVTSGEILEFYEVDGALGGKLAFNENGELLWDVENITTTYYSPATSAFSFGGNCFVYRHKFDTKSSFVGSEKTDQITAFMW